MPRLFITFLLFLGTAIIWFSFLRNEWQAFELLREENKNLDEISVELDELTQRRDELIEEVNTLSKTALDRMEAALPQGPHAADFLVILENISFSSGISIKNVDLAVTSAPDTAKTAPSPGALPRPGGTVAVLPKSGESVNSLPVTLAVAGSYEAFKKFLSGLEKNLRLIEVFDISFGAAPKSELFQFKLGIKTYYQ